VLEVIVNIAQSMKFKDLMLNERYLHHYFSHILQERYNLLDLTKAPDSIILHPEWPTYKSTTNLEYGRYTGKMPTEDGTHGSIDFAIGEYKKPNIGIEFKLVYSWKPEDIVFDFLKMLDERNPFDAVFSFNVILRKNGLTRSTTKSYQKLVNKMNDAYKEAVRRLNNFGVDESREIYFVVSEIAEDNRRHWHYDKTLKRFKSSLPHLN
jgi:hypothetical protein